MQHTTIRAVTCARSRASVRQPVVRARYAVRRVALHLGTTAGALTEAVSRYTMLFVFFTSALNYLHFRAMRKKNSDEEK